MKKIIILSSILSLALYSGSSVDNMYLGDGFNMRHSKVKESFIKSIAKNRAKTNTNGASYVEIKNDDEFKEALKSGELGKVSAGNGITKEYRYIDIKNVNIKKNELEDIGNNELLIGTKVNNKKEELMQNINIRNSKIDTEKRLNIGVVSAQKKVEGISTFQNISNSQMKGGQMKNLNSGTKHLLDKFDEDF